MKRLIALCGTQKRAVCFLVFAGIALALMITIFCFSAQPAEVSQDTSDGFFATVQTMVTELYNGKVPPAVETLLIDFHAILRKLAHAFVYCLLGTAFCGMFCSLLRPRIWWQKAAVSFGCAALYAISDECHQLFVPGRSCEARDVLIDSAGIVVGICLSLCVVQFLRLQKRRKDR